MIRTSNRAALYARFSSDNQRSESIDAQVRAMETYCHQHNYTIVNTYIDEAKSATTDRRPSFQQMVADSSCKTFNILLVHKLDRFARNRYDSAVYKRELKRNGVTVYSVLENLDDSPESIMMESVLEGMSEYYSQNLAREVMKGMRETALQCKHTGGKPPLGYDIDPDTKKLIINPHEAETVRLIYSMYAAGDGYSAILEALHNQNVHTKNGGEFQKNSLHSILTNCKYNGVYIFNRSSPKTPSGTRNSHKLKDPEEVIAIDGGCPRIVDEETFAMVQTRITGNKHLGGRNNAKENYLLSGKVYCKECGRAMVGNTRRSGRNKDIYITYRCPSKKYNCTNREINRDYLEAYVVRLLEQDIFNTKAMKSLVKKIGINRDAGRDSLIQERNKVEKSLLDITAALNNVADAVAAGLMSSALIDRLNELEGQKAILEAERNRLASIETCSTGDVDIQLIPSEYSTLAKTPASPAYKAFIQNFINRIEVGRYSVTLSIKTGLEILPTLDTAVSIKRQELYELGKH